MAELRNILRSGRVAIALLALAAPSVSAQEAYAPVERSRTMRLNSPFPLMFEMHRRTTGLALLSSSWPAPCGGMPISTPECPDPGKLGWGEGRDRLSAKWIAGFEERLLEDDAVEAFDVGAAVSGRKGAVSFWLDARVFSEIHSEEGAPSWDGEFVERQEAGDDSRLDYVSYARYRGSFSVDLSWGRLAWRRDAPHWGPAYFHALVFNREAVPFDHFLYEGELGPLRVVSMVGDLTIDGWGRWRKNRDARTVYAHRYELALHPAFTLGASEQLVLYEDQALWAAIPVVPLFMAKGQLNEDDNNGNLAFDAQWRVFPGLRLYGEFLIDDMSEPTSLFNDFWKNRWAATAGAHAAWNAGPVPLGAIAEWTRIEPWVGTHYKANTAQALNHGAPLGDPLGPNAMALTLRGYVRPGDWTLALTTDWSWKGTDEGSSPEDVRDEKDKSRKTFLYGADVLWTISPELVWNSGIWGASARFSWNRETTELVLRAALEI